MRALRRRYGRAYGLPSSARHAYRDLLVTLLNNPGQPAWMLRHWGQQSGAHKAITMRALSAAERRGHVEVHAGRYYLTPRGHNAARGG